MWFQLGSAALGVWLMIAPAAIPTSPGAAVIDRIAGPIAIFIAVLAQRSVTRPARVVNVLTGLFLLIAIWLVQPGSAHALNDVLVGWLLIILALIRGKVRAHTGGGWWTILEPDLYLYDDVDALAPDAQPASSADQ
jgi:hypothetical protein